MIPSCLLPRAVLTLALSLSAAAFPALALTGDVNDDGRLDSHDAADALAVSGGLRLSGSVQNGDVAGGAANTPDGRVSLPDAVRIRRVLTGLDAFAAPVVVAPLQDTVTLTADLAKTWTLPRAWRVQGTLSGPLDDDAEGTEMVFIPRQSPIGESHAWVELPERRYSTVVSSGLNDVFVDTAYYEYGDGDLPPFNYVIRQPASPATLEVSGDATRDFSRPAVPAAGTVSGSLNAPGWNVSDLTLVLNNGGMADASPDDETPTSYVVKSGPGTGYLQVEGASDDDSTELFASLSGSAVTVAPGGSSTSNITLPPLTLLTGTLSGGTGGEKEIGVLQTLAGGSYMQAVGEVDDETNAYTLATPSGNVRLVYGEATYEEDGSFNELVNVQAYTVPAGGKRADFTLAAPPALRRLNGRVEDPLKKPLAGVYVRLVPSVPIESFTTGWIAAVGVWTGADGTFSARLPNGSYTVFLVPPDAEEPLAVAARARRAGPVRTRMGLWPLKRGR